MFKKYAALLRRSIALTLEYRAGVLIWMVVNVMPLVMLAVWYSLAEGGPIAGYSQTDFVSYYLLMTWVRQMTNVWVIWELDYEIRHGDLSVKLLHPLNPIHDYFAGHLADKIFRFVVLLPLAFLVWLIFPTIHYDLTPINLGLFIAMLITGYIIRFVTQYSIALLAFWVSEATTLNDIWFAFQLMLGGIVAPLDLFTEQVRIIANYLPFRFMLSFPVEILSGRLSSTDMAMGVALTLFWLAFFIGVYRWLWARGVKQFGAYGA
ncbi:MAG: ABC-2 family transporter protein [Chloroflexi bacterium]|nr:ABC-2 family transporter protein [Chloroflexota bacterium]